MTMKWTEDRVKEYDLLVELVGIARGLNSGSNIIGKIQRLDHLAEALTTTDWDKVRADFMQFLRERIVEDRKEGKL